MYELTRLFRSPEGEGGAGEGEGTPGEGGDKGGQQTKTFTEEQVNKIVAERLSRDRKSRPDESAIRQKILADFGLTDEEALRKAKEYLDNQVEIEKREMERKGQYEKALAKIEKDRAEERQNLEKDRDGWRGKYEKYYKNDKLTTAALKAGAEPSSVDLLVRYAENSIRITEDGNLQVIDYKGEVRMDTSDPLREMTVEGYLKELLTQYPNLAKSSGSPGSGAKPSIKTGQYTADDIRHFAQTDLKKYKELKDAGIVDQVLKDSLGNTT